ncbi:RimI Acetyltransferases [Rhabdaerophilaceae bacterium]
MTEQPRFSIRPMIPADREAVIDLIWALNLFENALTDDRVTERQDAEECLKEDEDAVQKHPGGALLVADIDGSPIGFLALSMNKGSPFTRADMRGHGHVLDLIVSEDFRNQGIGQALLARAEELTKAAGYRNLLIGLVETNTNAQRAYTKFGFKPHAREMIKRIE